MSMFWCAECGEMCDADDGCEEAPERYGKFELLCVNCADELQAEAEEAADHTSMIDVGGKRDGGSAS